MFVAMVSFSSVIRLFLRRYPLRLSKPKGLLLPKIGQLGKLPNFSSKILLIFAPEYDSVASDEQTLALWRLCDE